MVHSRPHAWLHTLCLIPEQSDVALAVGLLWLPLTKHRGSQSCAHVPCKQSGELGRPLVPTLERVDRLPLDSWHLVQRVLLAHARGATWFAMVSEAAVLHAWVKNWWNLPLTQERFV